jgi:uncharacterized membrane protein
VAHGALAEEKNKEIITSKTLNVMKWPIIGIVISLVLILVGFLCDSTRLTMAGVVFLMCNVGVIIGIKLKQKEQ